MAEAKIVDESQPVNEESFVILNQSGEDDSGEELTVGSPGVRLPAEMTSDQGFQKQHQGHAMHKPSTLQMLLCKSDENVDKDDSFALINSDTRNESEKADGSSNVNRDCAELRESQKSYNCAKNRTEIASRSQEFDEKRQLKAQCTNVGLQENDMNQSARSQEMGGLDEHEHDVNPHDENLLQLGENSATNDSIEEEEGETTKTSKKDSTKTGLEQLPSQYTMDNLGNGKSTKSKNIQPTCSENASCSDKAVKPRRYQCSKNKDSEEKVSHDRANATRNADQSQSYHTSMSPVLNSDSLSSMTKSFENETDTSTIVTYQEMKTATSLLKDFSSLSNPESFCVLQPDENSVGNKELSSSTEEDSNMDLKHDINETKNNSFNLPNVFAKGANEKAENKTTYITCQKQITDSGNANDEVFAGIDKVSSIVKDKTEPFEQSPVLCGFVNTQRKETSHKNEPNKCESQSGKRIGSPRLNAEKDKIIIDDESMIVKGAFGEIRLLKVEKFWLISLNAVKSKLPSSINTDTTLRLEIMTNIIMLVTDSKCFNVRVLGNKLSLEENQSYFPTNYNLLENEDCHRCQMVLSSTNGNQLSFTEGKSPANRSTSPIVDVADEHNAETKSSSKDTSDDYKANGSKSLKTSGLNQAGYSEANEGKEETEVIKLPEKYDKMLDMADVDERSAENKVKENEHPRENKREPEKKDTDSLFNENGKGIVRLDGTGLAVRGSFGEVKLIKVGKFWLISFNGLKSKLPTTINTVQYLKFEIEFNEPLLVSPAVCYKVKLNDNNLTLEENNSYLQEKRIETDNKQGDTSRIDMSQMIHQETTQEKAKIMDEIEDKNTTCDTEMDELNGLMMQMSVRDTKTGTSGEHTGNNRQNLVHGQNADDGHNIVTTYLPDLKDTDKGNSKTASPGSYPTSATITRRVEIPNNLPWKRVIEEFQIEENIRRKFNLAEALCLHDGMKMCLQISGQVENVRDAEDFIEKDVVKKIIKKEIILRFQVMDTFEKTSICKIIERDLSEGIFLQFENNKLFIICFGDQDCDSVGKFICNRVTEKIVALTGSWRREERIKAVIENLQQTERGAYISTEENRTRLIVTGLKEVVNDIFRQIEKQMVTGDVTRITRGSPPTIRTYKLTPCDRWLQLSKKFELSKVLSCQDKLVVVEFKETQKEKFENVCECTIKGEDKNGVDAISKLFFENYVNKLNYKTFQSRIKRLDILRKTKLCSLIDDRYPDVLLLPEKDGLTLLTFNETADLLSLSSSIRRDLIDSKIQLQGPWKQPEQAHKLVEKIGIKYDKIYTVIDETDLSLYIVGIKDHVNAATNEIVQRMAEVNTITKTLCLENGSHLDILMKDLPFRKEMETKHAVDIQNNPHEECLKVHGEIRSVLQCEKDLQKYCSDVMTEEVFIDKDKMEKVDSVLSNVGNQNHVIIESQLQSVDMKKAAVDFKDDSKDRKSYTFQNGQKLIILDPLSGYEDSGSNVIVNIREGKLGLEGYTRHHDHGLIKLKLSVPVWSEDAVRKTKGFIRKILTEVGEDNESVIDFKIPVLQSWSTDDVLSCFLEVIYRYSVDVKKGTNPQFIILTPEATDYEFFVGTCKIQINELLTAIENQKAQKYLRISVVEGKLNEIKVDVLVNTTAANLDLKQGAVSSALLNTAGHEMQVEVRRQYARLLQPGEIAITKGYKLQCVHVFHGTLSIFDETRRDTLKGQYQSLLRKCLTKANELKATSIAFPAIGIGNLRYPISFVTREMFTTVNEFKESTTLQQVYFVVFPEDRSAVQAFRKHEQEDSRTKEKSRVHAPNECHMVEIKVTGHKENVRRAVQTIKSDQKKRQSQEENNLKPMSYADAIKLPTPTVAESLSLPSVIRHAFRCETPESLWVRVYASDILHLPVDCIVNLGDSNLDNITGLSSLIADAAGDKLKAACRDHIRQNGRMRIGQVMKTSAANLKYRCILHAAWPQWVDYTPHTEDKVLAYQNDLKKTIVASLNLAEDECLSTLAIPTITENQNAPVELSVIQLVTAIKDFSRSRPKQYRCLREVHCVDVDDKNTGLLKQGFAEMIINNQTCPWNWRVYVKQQKGAIDKIQQPERSGDKDICNSLPYCMEFREGLTCKFTQTRIVNISHGDLTSYKTSDAVVCSEDPSGAAAGAVAKLLLQKGGRSYEQEKSSQYQMNRFKTGDIFITSGGSSGFRQIIHAIMPHRLHFPKQGEEQWENALGDIINKIFDTVEKRKYESVVMSLLGTGAGSSDPKQCARILLDSFRYSCTRYPDSILFLDVVNYDINRHQVVVSVFKEGVNQSRGYTSQKMWISGSKADRSISSKKTTTKTSQKCSICLDNLKQPKTLKCGHVFCSGCIEKCFKVRAICPICKTVCGVIVGDQPDGEMIVDISGLHLPGYSCRTFTIKYKFNKGKQKKNHPSPGKVYSGTERIAYLPDTKAGREVCALLKLAFERRLVFTIGTSRTSGEEGITWNDIHHKTHSKPNSAFGYPDHGYMERVKQELADKGVTKADTDFDKSLFDKLNRGHLTNFPVTIHVPVIGTRVSSV